jgi:hypothetical protein
MRLKEAVAGTKWLSWFTDDNVVSTRFADNGSAFFAED